MDYLRKFVKQALGDVQGRSLEDIITGIARTIPTVNPGGVRSKLFDDRAIELVHKHKSQLRIADKESAKVMATWILNCEPSLFFTLCEIIQANLKLAQFNANLALGNLAVHGLRAALLEATDKDASKDR